MAYPDPFRLRVLKALTAALQEITPANGYRHDLSTSVFRGRDLFGEDDPLPLVSILEATDEAGQDGAPHHSGYNKGTWGLLIQGFCEDDLDHPTDPAHYLMADVKQRLAAEQKRGAQFNILGMGGLVDQMTFTPGIVRPADAYSAKAYFWLKLDLVLVEDVTKPYE